MARRSVLAAPIATASQIIREWSSLAAVYLGTIVLMDGGALSFALAARALTMGPWGAAAQA